MKIVEMEILRDTILRARKELKRQPQTAPMSVISRLDDADQLLVRAMLELSTRNRAAGRVKSEAKTVNCRKAAQINADRIRKND